MWSFVVVNNSLTVTIGESATVGEDVEVIIDCQSLIADIMNEGVPNSSVTWYKNGIILINGPDINVVISKDKRYVK